MAFNDWVKRPVQGVSGTCRYAPDGVLAVGEVGLSWCFGVWVGSAPGCRVFGDAGVSWGFSEVGVWGGSGGGVSGNGDTSPVRFTSLVLSRIELKTRYIGMFLGVFAS